MGRDTLDPDDQSADGQSIYPLTLEGIDAVNAWFCLVVAGVLANNSIELAARHVGDHDFVRREVYGLVNLTI